LRRVIDSTDTQVAIQQAYYASTARQYDTMHVSEKDEHAFALGVIAGLLEFIGVRSVLDVGAGTGRAMRYLMSRRPDLLVRGVEPVAELRACSGLPAEQLVDGSALALSFGDASFDLVCAFGILHHIEAPDRAVAEMLRVAKTAVFISDSNNFGQGSSVERAVKQMLRAVCLWPLADWIKTRGKRYTITEGDGLAYSYSVFPETYRQLRSTCTRVHAINTETGGPNLYRSAGHVAVLGIKA